ncbi:MAG TPA: RNA-directed DNA polymerase [Ignavibacteria bacterium]
MLKLQPNILDWSLKHIEKYGDTDIFPVPFEYEAIRYSWDLIIKQYIASQNILDWSIRPHRRSLTPKHKYGFRISTQLDPFDCIIFTTLVAEIGNDIEASRIPKENNISFSNHFKMEENGEMFDSSYNWSEFQKHSKSLADTNNYPFVVLADIADFYPRIYSHPLENTLKESTKAINHVNAIINFLKKINFTISIGIPVGISSSRLLAELVLDDVDRGLLSENSIFCRYIDDYRIFCTTKKEAHAKLSFLANILYENHGLTLQQHKTRIIATENFNKDYLMSDEKKEVNNLKDKFSDIISELGLEDDPYKEINYNDLTDEQKAKVDSLNLVEIIETQSDEKENIDIPLTRFVLKRLAQVGNIEPLDSIIDNIDNLYPVFKDVMLYINDSRHFSNEHKHRIGTTLLNLLSNSVSCHLEYHKLWMLSIFTKNSEWDNEDKFVSLYNDSRDDFSRRKLILALGRSENINWFKSHKRDVNNFPPWNKRAFIAAASCLPGDEYNHWLRSINSNLDPLEKAIGIWANDNRF